MPPAIDFTTAEVRILDILYDGQFSAIFLASAGSLKCAMKVYHNNIPSGPDGLGFVSIFELEKAAYVRLAERGLCDKGIVPQYYGSIEKLNLKRLGHYLNGFRNDANAPDAIFLEYLPSMKMLDLDTYSDSRMSAFIHGMKLIQAAHVIHMDIRPRNMMILSESTKTDRVIWMDFDRAKTCDDHCLTEDEERFMKSDMRMLEQLGPKLAEDQKKGFLDASYIYFCT